MDVEKLEAGRELDAEIHCKVFGIEVEMHCLGGRPPGPKREDRLPHYSTELNAALEVAKKLALIHGPSFGTYSAGTPIWSVSAPTWPLAICRAALKAAAR